MSRNFTQPGTIMELTAPSGGVVSGVPELIGSLFAVPLATAAVGVKFSGQVAGVFTLAKTSAQAWTEGQKIYWDDGNSRCDSLSTVGQLIGVAAAVAADPTATGSVRLNGSAPATAEGAQAALTSPLTGVTASAPGTPDYAIADLTSTTPFGFVSADEGQTILSVITNLQARQDELEARLQAAGIIL